MGRSKHLVANAAQDFPVPEGQQQIGRVCQIPGGNLVKVEQSNGEKILCMIPTKFKNTLWIKRGTFLPLPFVPLHVLISPSCRQVTLSSSNHLLRFYRNPIKCGVESSLHSMSSMSKIYRPLGYGSSICFEMCPVCAKLILFSSIQASTVEYTTE